MMPVCVSQILAKYRICSQCNSLCNIYKYQHRYFKHLYLFLQLHKPHTVFSCPTSSEIHSLYKCHYPSKQWTADHCHILHRHCQMTLCIQYHPRLWQQVDTKVCRKVQALKGSLLDAKRRRGASVADSRYHIIPVKRARLQYNTCS